MREVYYLWSLAGGDLEVEMKTVGLIPSEPPIFSVPRYNSLSRTKKLLTTLGGGGGGGGGGRLSFYLPYMLTRII